MNANPETQHKVLILGNQEVGKTAIVNSVSFVETRIIHTLMKNLVDPRG